MPCYFLACDIFRAHQLEVVPIRNPNGPGAAFDVGAVAAALEQHPSARLLYLVPTNCNPTGHTLSDESRRELVALCAAHGTLIVADEVYHLLDWKEGAGSKPQRMASYDPKFRDVPLVQAAAPHVAAADRIQLDAKATATAKAAATATATASPDDEYSSKPGQARTSGGGGGGDGEEGTVISISSFTKIWSPGLRLGWIEVGLLMAHSAQAPLLGSI